MKTNKIIRFKAYLIFFGILFMCYNSHSQKIKGIDLFVSGNENVKEFRIPSMITTIAGTVLTVCDARVNRRGDVPNNIDLVVKRSLDNGKTWSTISRAVDFPNMEGAADPSLVQDNKTGRIFLFYGYSAGRNNIVKGLNRDRRYLSLHYVFSDDDGQSWSMPIVVEHGIKKEGWHSLWPGPGRGLQLKNNRLIMPVTVYEDNNINTYYLFSDNHGASWDISVRIGVNINEPTIVELDNGDLLMNCRNKSKKRALVTSSDNGATWSAPLYHEELIEPSCQGSFISTEYKGKSLLLFSNPSSIKGRKNMTIKGSFDNGKTWPIEKQIFEGPSAYSCLTILPNGDVGLLYETGEKSPYEGIRFVSLKMKQIVKAKK